MRSPLNRRKPNDDDAAAPVTPGTEAQDAAASPLSLMASVYAANDTLQEAPGTNPAQPGRPAGAPAEPPRAPSEYQSPGLPPPPELLDSLHRRSLFPTPPAANLYQADE